MKASENGKNMLCEFKGSLIIILFFRTRVCTTPFYIKRENNHYYFIQLQILPYFHVSVVSSDPPCKDGNARFTTVPLTPKSDLNVVFLIRKVCISVSSLQLLRKKRKCTSQFAEKSQMKTNNFKKQKHGNLIHT